MTRKKKALRERPMKDPQWLNRVLMYGSHCIAFCATEAIYVAAMKDLKVENPPLWCTKNAGATTHELEYKGQRVAIVCLNVPLLAAGNHTLEDAHAMLVHEAAHIWRYIRDDLGEQFPSSELEAYAMQNISLNLMVAYRKWRTGK